MIRFSAVLAASRGRAAVGQRRGAGAPARIDLARILANVHPGDPAMQRAQRASPTLFDKAAKGIAHFRPEQGVIDPALAASPSM